MSSDGLFMNEYERIDALGTFLPGYKADPTAAAAEAGYKKQKDAFGPVTQEKIDLEKKRMDAEIEARKPKNAMASNALLGNPVAATQVDNSSARQTLMGA